MKLFKALEMASKYSVKDIDLICFNENLLSKFLEDYKEKIKEELIEKLKKI